ncbi:MAG TPA: outer membrane beta-barrel protein, partial [Polyangiaceae bacterium]|nr:outer membrane beta-barrel protein [Polyangiaceae bacterium]
MTAGRSLLVSVVMVIEGTAFAQPPPAEPPPAEQALPQETAPDRLTALEERVRVLEEEARVAKTKAAESEKLLDELRRERDAEREAQKRAEEDAKGKEEGEADGPTAKFDGYVEANYAYNFNRPSNGITNFRGFDNRHDSFTISNAMLGATFGYQELVGRLALQIGHAPSTYYLAEPVSPGTAGAASSDAGVWKYIQ